MLPSSLTTLLLCVPGLSCVASYQLRVVSSGLGAGLSPGAGLGLGLGSGPGRPQSYVALSGDLLVEIRQLPVWARGRRLQLLLLEHASNGPPVATSPAAGSNIPEFTVQGSITVNVATNAASTAANTGGRLQWVRGYNRSSGVARSQAAAGLGKMTSTWRPDNNRTLPPPRPGPPRPGPTTLKPIAAKFPCGFVSRGGRYALRLVGLDRSKKTANKEDSDEENESGERPTTRAGTKLGGKDNRVAASTSDTNTTANTSSNNNNNTTGNNTTFNDPSLPATNEVSLYPPRALLK